MSFEVSHELVKFAGLISYALISLIHLGLHREDLIHDLFQIVNESIVTAFHLLIGLVDDSDEDLTIVLDALSQGLEIRIDKLAELVDSLIKDLEVRKHGLFNRVFHFLDLGEASGLGAFQEFVELTTVDRKMALYDLKTLIDVFLHVLMVDEMLLELLSELGAKSLDVFDLLPNSASDLDDFLIDVARKEVGPLSRVMSCVLHILDELLDRLIGNVLNACDLKHDIFDKVLNQRLGLLVCGES